MKHRIISLSGLAQSILESNKESKLHFDNWVRPSIDILKREFRVEHEYKGHEFWEGFDEFLDKVNKAEVEKITPAVDRKIGYRSRKSTYDDILDLISTYGSYPKYRNENTVKAIYTGFKENQPMEMPIVVEFQDGTRRVFAGNTRMDIAFQLGIDPEVLIVRSDS